MFVTYGVTRQIIRPRRNSSRVPFRCFGGLANGGGGTVAALCRRIVYSIVSFDDTGANVTTTRQRTGRPRAPVFCVPTGLHTLPH